MLPGLGLGGFAAFAPTSQWVQTLWENSCRLEADMDGTIQLIGALAKLLRPLVAESDFAPALAAVLEAEQLARKGELRQRIDAHVAQGQEPQALRDLRDLTGMTWDEVYLLCDTWAKYSDVEKQRWERRHYFRQAMNDSKANHACTGLRNA